MHGIVMSRKAPALPEIDLGMSAEKIVYIVAPSGAVGGGMGRVKDYILQGGGAPGAGYRLEALVTRDSRGLLWSLLLLCRAVLIIWIARFSGRLALVHVNLGDKGSAFRKGFVILGARLVGAPVILHLHAAELIDFYARGNPLLRFCLRAPFRAASSIIVLGHLWRLWLIEELAIPADKIDVLYNGVPVDVRPRDFAAEATATRKILFLGLLSERKGISDFIAALGAMPETAPAWRAIVAGNGDIPFYEAKAGEAGISPRTEFRGWVDQAGVRALLREVDVMVLPSYNEGLPLVILEALGAGTPVITTPIGAIPEVLEDGRNVIFVEPGDRLALSAAVLRVISDVALRQSLSTMGQERFRQRFSLEAFLDSLFAIYARRFDVLLRRETPDEAAGVRA